MLDTASLSPHAVHVADPYEVDDVPVQTFDPSRAETIEPDGEDITPARKILTVNQDTGDLETVELPEVRSPYWFISNSTRRYVGPIDCPDCGKGLSWRGTDMLCVRLQPNETVTACHEGCTVACGGER